MEVVEPVASKVGEWLVPLVVRHCGYMICSDRYVRELNEEVVKLEPVKQRVQHSIDEAQKYGKPIEADVKKWMEDAENATKKARPAQAHGPTLPSVDEMGIPPITGRSVEGGGNGEAKKTCFCGWLPNLKERYRVGREAKKTVKDIRELIAQGQFQKVYFENDAPGLVGGATDLNSLAGGDGADTITDSRASIFEGMMKALDDEKKKVIGVYGDGGVGKSTLLKEVEKKLRKDRRPFHMIAKSTVSNISDLKKIQDDIAYAFGVNLTNESSDVGRRNLLSKTLKDDPTKKVLIILDDLWDKLDLEAVGIPSGDESTKCKLLLASRDESVLQQKMGADETFRLEGLSNEEAFRLFKKICGNKLKDDEGFKAKAYQVVAKLPGLPLLIKSVASTLKYGDESTWDNALTKIEDPNIKSIVEWSYGRLESDEIKSLFLLCGFVGGSIPVELLLGLGMGLSLFKGFDMRIRSSTSKLNEMLHRLRSICLLQDGGDAKENVTIHDLYSEVVVSTPLTGQNLLMTHGNAGSWPKEKLEKCWVCLVNVGSDRLAELKLQRLPDSEIFMLSKQHDKIHCDGLDFASMKELRVLFLHSINFTSLCSSIEILKNLQSLYLDHCDVEDVAILGELKELQILSFAGSSIYSLPKEIGKLTKLKLLNLTCCWLLENIEPGIFKGLINLEELYMRKSFDKWMDEDEISSASSNAKFSELKSLTHLTTLEISIIDPNVLLQYDDLPFGDLIKFWINIGNVDERKFEGLTSMMLDWEECDGILSKEWVQKTLQKTQYLHLDGLIEFKKSAHELCRQGFLKLKHLDIRNCSSIKHIVSSSNGALPILESLFLENLTNLDKISDNPECFSHLKVIEVTKCDRLEYLLCLSQMRRLAQLEKIVVRECDSIRAIAIDNVRKDTVVADNKVELPDLRRLKLEKLPKMTSFCIEAGITSDGAPIQVSFPHLESLVMVGFLDMEKILYGQPPLEYSNLKSLVIKKPQSKSSILQSDLILKLPNLGSLEIQDSSAEVVFNLEKQDVQLQGILIFQNLKKLDVNFLTPTFLFPISVAKCLRGIIDIKVWFCDNMEALVVDEDGRDEGTNDIIEFPLLKRLSIMDCPKLKLFSYFRGKKESLPTTSDSKDACSDSFFDRKISLPSLEYLHIKSGGPFKRIWPRELPKSSLDNLAELGLYVCSEVLNVFPSTVMGRWPKLRSVGVSSCPSLESVFECGPPDSSAEQTGVLLPNLEDIAVAGCPSLESVFDRGSQTVLGLPSLASVEVTRCSELTYLFPYPTAATLEKLKRLEIRECIQMKEVILKEEGSRSNAEVLSFPSLKDLCIFRCHPFVAFIQNPTIVKRQLGKTAIENDESPQPFFNEMVSLPNISRLDITGSQCKELWNNQVPIDSFCKLKELALKHCDNLQRIAPSHIWKKWHRCLEFLEVVCCDSIEIIYESDGTHTKIVKLRKLHLHGLDNLRHIWQYDGLSNIPFPNLRFIQAWKCPSLGILFPTFTAEFLGQIEELSVDDCENMKLIADHGECEEATSTTIAFSKLTQLRLTDLPKIKKCLPEKYSVEFPVIKYQEVPALHVGVVPA